MSAALKKEKQWVLWCAEKVGDRMTKIPYTIRGKRASSTDPSDWSTYAEVKRASGNFGDGIGVVFTPARTLLGIDIDHVLTDGKLAGEHAEMVAQLIKKARTYTEVSPSGTGLHLYLSLPEAFTPKANRHAPFEFYTAGRFFTFTEVPFGAKKAAPIREAGIKEVEALLGSVGYPWDKQTALPTNERATSATKPFTDAQVLEHMFGSKNGKAIRALYEGDASAYLNEKQKPDLSRADAALLNHLAFWTRKDEVQMLRIWLASPLGQREKTQKREDYQLRTARGAIRNCKEVYRTQVERAFDEFGIDFVYTSGPKGEPILSKNVENVCRAFRHHPQLKDRLRLDTFKNRVQLREGEVWRPFVDVDAINLQREVSVLFEFLRNVSKDMVFDAVMSVAKEYAIDSAQDFVRSLTWDGEARLDFWLAKTFGTADDLYHQKVGSNWLKGLIKRVMEPGCKFDYVLSLEGEQGAKKSTSLAVLGAMPNGESWHVETTMSTDNKDFFMQFEGKVIVEFSEGETATRTEVKKMKAIITTAVDRYRPSYGRTSEDFPRHCVFAMTTNQDEYLKDETGNRRWLPVRVVFAKADIEWLAANRDQLFAEAHARLVAGETTWEFPEEETRAQQELRRVSDPNEERIANWYYAEQFGPRNRDEGITIHEAWCGALGNLPSQSMKKFEEMQIADVFRRVLKLKKVRKIVAGVLAVRWVNEEEMAERQVLVLPDGINAEDLPF